MYISRKKTEKDSLQKDYKNNYGNFMLTILEHNIAYKCYFILLYSLFENHICKEQLWLILLWLSLAAAFFVRWSEKWSLWILVIMKYVIFIISCLKPLISK